MNQMEVESMFERWDEITVREFNINAEKQPKPYNVKLKDATIDQVMHAFADVMCHELIERLPVSDILCTKDSKEVNFAKIRKYVDSKTATYKVNDAIEKYLSKRFGSTKQKREFLENYNIPVLPVTQQLVYSYDYGDGWEIKITCTNAWYDRSVYARDEEGNMRRDRNGFVPEKVSFVDAYNKPIEGEFLEKMKEIEKKEKPICIAWDGLSLLDDVGGIGGFCEFLEIINGDDSEAKKSYKTWARSLGWTGRMPKPEKML